MIVIGWLVGCGLYSAKTATLRHSWERLRPLGERGKSGIKKAAQKRRLICWGGECCPLCLLCLVIRAVR